MRFAYNNRLAGNEATHLDLRSGSLSWSEHRALLSTAAATAAAAHEAAYTRRAIQELQYEVAGVANAVDSMERSLALRLDTQTVLLRTEIELLANIATSLRTPRATRAAERIVDAGALLDDGRHERALAAAQEAIEDDPNNRRGFIAAGWALLGLERTDEARSHFREAAQCGGGDGAHSALRQAARLTFVLNGPAEALEELDKEAGSQLSDLENAAADFDRLVYSAAVGNSDEAVRTLQAATEIRRGFCLMALTDPVCAGDKRVVDAAVGLLKELDALRKVVEQEYEPISQHLRSLLKLNMYDDIDDASGSIVAEIASAVDAVDQYRTVQTEDWGFADLRRALDDASNHRSPAHAAARRAEDYVREQQEALQVLRDRVPRAVRISAPRKRDGVWEVVFARKVGVSYAFYRATSSGSSELPVNLNAARELEALFGIRLRIVGDEYFGPVNRAIKTQGTRYPPWAYLDY